LVLVDLNFDTDRFESDDVFLPHDLLCLRCARAWGRVSPFRYEFRARSSKGRAPAGALPPRLTRAQASVGAGRPAGP
jgi:hypothetical protein